VKIKVENKEVLFMPMYTVFLSGEVTVQAENPEDAIDEAVRLVLDKEMELGEDSGFSFEVVEVPGEEDEIA
jgi:hypothetical protein